MNSESDHPNIYIAFFQGWFAIGAIVLASLVHTILLLKESAFCSNTRNKVYWEMKAEKKKSPTFPLKIWYKRDLDQQTKGLTNSFFTFIPNSIYVVVPVIAKIVSEPTDNLIPMNITSLITMYLLIAFTSLNITYYKLYAKWFEYKRQSIAKGCDEDTVTSNMFHVSASLTILCTLKLLLLPLIIAAVIVSLYEMGPFVFKENVKHPM